MNGLITVRLSDVHADARKALKADLPVEVRGIEIDAVAGPFLTADFGDSAARDFAGRIARTGRVLAVVRCDTGSRRLADPANLDSRMNVCLNAIQFASRIGARVLIVHTGHPGNEADTAGHPFHTAIMDLAQAADRHGVRLCVESTGWTVAERLEYLETRRLASIQMEFDPALDALRGLSADESLVRLADRLGAIRLKDGYRGGGDAPFGKGDVPWRAVAMMLDATAYPGPRIVVPHTTPGESMRESLIRAVNAVVKLHGAPGNDSVPGFGGGRIWVPSS